MNTKHVLLAYVLFFLSPLCLRGQFAPPVIIDDISNLTPKTIAAADIDNDGDMDIVVGGLNQRQWYPNDGLGQFLDPVAISGIFSTLDMDIGDLDGDGDDDIILISGAGIAWQRNDGNGVFSDPIMCESLNPFDPIFGHSIQILDLNNDGFLDLAYNNNDAGQVTINPADGSFPTSLAQPNQVIPYAFENAFGDVDGDGYPDMLRTEMSEFTVVVEYNDGEGGFGSPTPVAPYMYVIIDADMIADVNNDGYGDPIYGISDRSVVAYTLDGGNTFFTRTIDEEDVNVVDVMDVDGDGLGDLLAYRGTSQSQVRFYHNLGDFEFESIQLLDDSDNVAPIFANLYNEEKPDVLVVNDGQLIWFRNITQAHYTLLHFFDDTNESGVQDEGEVSIQNIKVDLTAPAQTYYSNVNGEVRLYLPAGDYTYGISNLTCWSLLEGSPTTFSFSWDGIEGDTTHFGLQLLHDDNIELSGALVSAPTRCNSPVRFNLLLNASCLETTGVVALVLDDNVSLVSATQTPDLIEGQTLWWNFEDIVPGGQTSWAMYLQMPNEEFTGDALGFQWYIYAADCEENPDANAPVSSLSQGLNVCQSGSYDPIVLCSYDPNDKQVIPNRGEEHNYTLFEETLQYTVRFQNTGNDTAFVVRIRDTLDNNLNWNSLHVMGSSHPCEVQLDRNTGEVIFTFDNILLVDSTTNEPASHGFIHFTIESLTGLPENALVGNQASIYFDFNPPIFTNTVFSELVSQLPVAPQTAFTYNIDGGTVVFQDESINEPLQWNWDFGDGQSSIERHPIHEFADNGDYNVCLTASNAQGADTACELIQVIITSVDEVSDKYNFTVAPNPTNGYTRITWSHSLPGDSYLQLYDLLGKAVASPMPVSYAHFLELDMEAYPEGTYFFRIVSREKSMMQGILIKS